MTTQTNDAAIGAYLQNLTNAQTLALDILDILGVLDNHETADPETLDWGEVGDMVEIRRSLQHIHDRLYAQGEYAPHAK
jgi:hypothetical protein